MNEDLRGIIGIPIDPITNKPIEVQDAREHFYMCKACGQYVDRRNLGEVFHHEEEGHSPLPTN